MNIRPETPFDHAAIAAVVTQAFEQAKEAQLIARIRHSDRYIPSLSLIAERGTCGLKLDHSSLELETSPSQLERSCSEREACTSKLGLCYFKQKRSHLK